MPVKGFSDDFWKQFRSPREKDEDEHCQNCDALLFDDDLDEPYERGYCRGCQVTRSSVKKLDTCIDAMNKFESTFTQLFKVKQG